jgi:hypothetical protein
MSRVTTPETVRARACELFRDHGATDVARILATEGHVVKPATVRQWAKRAGIVSERRDTVTPMLEGAAISHEERRVRLAEQMLTIAEAAAAQELELLADADLRSVVGARTRAIHDFQLLTGAATTRAEHGGTDKAHGLVDELAQRRQRSA